MSVLQEKVLVLNKSWQPIQVTTVRKAVTMVFHDTAQVVDPKSYGTFDFESWKEAAVFAKEATKYLHACSWKMVIPEVIVLRHYNGFHKRQVRFSRRNVFERDSCRCQYCGERFRTQDLTLDHVLPRSRGGHSQWENVVVACYRCNRRKANRTPREAHMRLLRSPQRPRWKTAPVHGAGGRIPASWEAFLDDLYWDQELKP